MIHVSASGISRRLTSAPSSIILTGLGCMLLAASFTFSDTPLVGVSRFERALLITCSLAVAFAFFVAATRVSFPAWVARAVCTLMLSLFLWAAVIGEHTVSMVTSGLVAAASTVPADYHTDDLFDNHYNALLVLRGQNPYTGNRLIGEMRYSRHYSDYTPITRGRFRNLRQQPTPAARSAVMRQYLTHPSQPTVEIDPRTEHSYPAGAFLVDVPFVWAGLPSITLPQIALFLALGAVLVASTPARWMLIVAVLYFSSLAAARQVITADFDIWPLALIIGAWLLRDRRIASSVLLGAACAIKQTAWFAAPFYLVWIWQTQHPRAAAERGMLALASFLAINLPWIVSSPGNWFASLWLPMSLPLVPGNDGLVALATMGEGPLWPSWVYSALELGALAGAVGWYWRAYQRYPFAGLVLSFVPLFFAWRSTERYFTLLPLAAVAALVLALREHAAGPPDTTRASGQVVHVVA